MENKKATRTIPNTENRVSPLSLRMQEDVGELQEDEVWDAWTGDEKGVEDTNLKQRNPFFMNFSVCDDSYLKPRKPYYIMASSVSEDSNQKLRRSFSSDSEQLNPKQRKLVSYASAPSVASFHLPLCTAPKIVVNVPKHEGNKFCFNKKSEAMNVPDWSKIYGNKDMKCGFWGLCDGDEGGEMIPPHIIIKNRRTRSNNAAYSMLEGVGRTLKGRDLINLRNAVLISTGFLEQ